jgi:aminocyclitol acetyltransferase
MDWEFDEILSKRLNGRELVAWGTGRLSSFISERISRDVPIAHYISSDAYPGQKFMGKDVFPPYARIDKSAALDKALHFAAIAASAGAGEMRDSLRLHGFEENIDYFDCFKTAPPAALPIDIEVGGVKIGKRSGFLFSRRIVEMCIASIGRYCSINETVQIAYNHPMNMISTKRIYRYFDEARQEAAKKQCEFDIANSTGTKKVSIGNDVWIGANAFINTSKCAKIGDGAIIGTGAIVLEDVPPYAIVYGAPARVHRYRYTPEQIETLLRVKWWDWDDATISANAELLMYPENFFRNSLKMYETGTD